MRAVILFIIFFSSDSFASGLSINVSGEDIFSSGVVQLIALISILSLAPSIVIMVTSFTRIIIVLSFLRTGIGLQQTPPNIVLTSLALFLTFFIMNPTFERAYTEGLSPLMDKKITLLEGVDKISTPFREFMLKQVGKRELKALIDIANLQEVKQELVPFRVLIPAFILSELSKSFEMGFLIFLPFLVIDMLVSSILMSMGMMMLPPASISLPFKIIFFVLIDGWMILSESFVKGFH